MELLGIGSRVKHPAFGDGVVVRLHVAAYEVCFMQFGLKMVGKEYSGWQVVERIPAEETVTFTEAEESLMRILRAWSGVSLEKVPLGDIQKLMRKIIHFHREDFDLLDEVVVCHKSRNRRRETNGSGDESLRDARGYRLNAG